MSTTKPGPRRGAVLELLGRQSRAVHVNEIAQTLAIEPQSYAALQRVLTDLAYDGSVVALAGQRFRLARQASAEPSVVEGFLSVHPRGFGFVHTDGLSDNLFVPQESLLGALHGDRVKATVLARGPRGLEGRVIEVVSRRSPRIAGIVRRRGKSMWLEPDDARIRGPIVVATVSLRDPATAPDAFESPEGGPRSYRARWVDGMAGVVRIDRFPELSDENPEGTLVAILGEPGDPQVEVAKVLEREEVVEPHPAAVLEEAAARAAEPIDGEVLAGREDLTEYPLSTIDPADARDHDDAVWAERRDDGSYRVIVAIADVAHYVRPATELDSSALERGCSIYLPDRAIPMLPSSLSSEICSLLPDVTRLCLFASIEIDPTGTPVSTRLGEGYIRCRASLTYEGVASALKLSKNVPRSKEAEALLPELEILWDLSRLLRARRLRRGALDLELPEARVQVDAGSGAPIGVDRRARDPGVGKAYQLIEEMMLLANEAVAAYFIERSIPTVFRVHGRPDEQRLERFGALCEELGVAFEPETAAEPKALSAFLKTVSKHPKKAIIHGTLIRSMKQAAYDVVNVGHFGLASDAYLHFTSPIRRYPDLCVHRALKAILNGTPVDRTEQGVERLRQSAMVASQRERRAMDVEREVVDLYRALFMRDKIGTIAEGAVAAVVNSGVFVALDDPYVEVLVSMENLGREPYEADEHALSAIAPRSKERVLLGDRLLVEIIDVSIERRTVYGRRILGRAEVAPDEGAPSWVERRAARRGARVAQVESPRRGGSAASRAGPGENVRARRVRASGSSGPTSTTTTTTSASTSASGPARRDRKTSKSQSAAPSSERPRKSRAASEDRGPPRRKKLAPKPGKSRKR